jgi:hypothetical protein
MGIAAFSTHPARGSTGSSHEESHGVPSRMAVVVNTTAVDQEETGRLVHGGDTALFGDVAQRSGQTVVVWEDNRHSSAQLGFSIWAQQLSLQ